VTDFELPPFAVALDIVLDLPPPPSVNKTRRVDWKGNQILKGWKEAADGYTTLAKCRPDNPIRGRKIEGTWEAIITFDSRVHRLDLDNGIKALLDYAKRIELVTDDSLRYLRRITVQWGTPPTGCRLVLRGMEA
jgi:Holliday junction resolvase RusA-like endonuclease